MTHSVAGGPIGRSRTVGRDGVRGRHPRRMVGTGNDEGPHLAVGPFDIVPGEALAEDTRFELVRGCPQHAFQACALGH